MAIGIYFTPAAVTAAKYDECIKLLKKAGAGNPPGRSYHSAIGPKDKLSVFEVWTSQAVRLKWEVGLHCVAPFFRTLPCPTFRTAP